MKWVSSNLAKDPKTPLPSRLEGEKHPPKTVSFFIKWEVSLKAIFYMFFSSWRPELFENSSPDIEWKFSTLNLTVFLW